MASTQTNETIRYESDERCPLFVSVGVALQGIMLVLAPTVLFVAITVRAAGLDDSYLTWYVFAALIINGVITALQASRLGWFGAGHVVITGPTVQFVVVSATALSQGGPGTLASLILVSSIFQFALAVWLPFLRRIITPVVSGTVLMLIPATVLPVAFDRLKEVPETTAPVRRTDRRYSDAGCRRCSGDDHFRRVAAVVSAHQHRGGQRGGSAVRDVRRSARVRCSLGRHT